MFRRFVAGDDLGDRVLNNLQLMLLMSSAGSPMRRAWMDWDSDVCVLYFECEVQMRGCCPG